MTSFHLWPTSFQLHGGFKWDDWFKTHFQHANPRYKTVTLGFQMSLAALVSVGWHFPQQTDEPYCFPTGWFASHELCLIIYTASITLWRPSNHISSLFEVVNTWKFLPRSMIMRGNIWSFAYFPPPQDVIFSSYPINVNSSTLSGRFFWVYRAVPRPSRLVEQQLALGVEGGSSVVSSCLRHILCSLHHV